MDQRYNSTLVNGIKIPSPDPAFRFVPMDVFPSEMLERLEVIKALTPSMEGDAIGGVMNLVMKSAPDRFVVSANVSGGFSTLFSNGRLFNAFHASPNSNSPAVVNGNSYAATYNNFNNNALTSNHSLNNPLSSTAGLTIGDRFLKGKLGVVVSASYQNIYRGSNSKRLSPNAQPNAVPLANTPQFSDAYDRTYSTQTERLGIHNKIDYVINSQNRISLYNLYIRQNEFESRLTSDTLGLGTNSTNLNKQVTISNRSTLTRQNIYNYGFRVVGSPVADVAHLSYGNNYQWADSLSVANQFYPTGYITQPQTTDIPSITTSAKYLPSNYVLGSIYDGSDVIQKNKPMFLNFPLPTSGHPLAQYNAIGTYNFHLQASSSLIGKGNTGILPLIVVPLNKIYGLSEATPAGADLGCYQLNGSGNQH